MESYDSWDDLEIGEEGSIHTSERVMPKMRSDRIKVTFLCYKWNWRYVAPQSQRSCPKWDDQFIEELVENRNNNNHREERKRVRSSLEGSRAAFNSRGFLTAIFPASINPYDRPEARRMRIVRIPVNESEDFFPPMQRPNTNSIFVNRRGNFRGPSASRGQVENIFDAIIRDLLREAGGSVKLPARNEVLYNLKPVCITKSDFIKNDETGNLEPPTCWICTDDISYQGIKLPCSHLFHKECITKWLKLHNACPIWRKEV